jgi:hypothetical protein
MDIHLSSILNVSIEYAVINKSKKRVAGSAAKFHPKPFNSSRPSSSSLPSRRYDSQEKYIGRKKYPNNQQIAQNGN